MVAQTVIGTGRDVSQLPQLTGDHYQVAGNTILLVNRQGVVDQFHKSFVIGNAVSKSITVFPTAYLNTHANLPLLLANLT